MSYLMPINLIRQALLVGVMVLVFPAHAKPSTTVMTGDLSRKLDKPLDSVEGARIEYGFIDTQDGARLRTIFSRPTGSQSEVPVIYFVQWLSCSTVELADDDGWTQMLTKLIGESGYALMRTEKSGVGDSEGPDCAELDYDTEVAHHRVALKALMARGDIDPKKVFVFGGSMGANQAPLVAADLDVAGIIAWGGGAKTWYERMLRFDRRALEFSAKSSDEIAPEMARRAKFHYEYLISQRTPADIIREDAHLEAVWTSMIGTSETAHYGRPFQFHWQAQNHNWAAAWSRIKAPVLILYGEFDWVEDADSHRFVQNLLNSDSPGQAEFVILEGTNHHFSRYRTRQQAFEEIGGEMVGDVAADKIMSWINSVNDAKAD